YVTPRGLSGLVARLQARQADLATLRARADRLDKLPEAAAERDIRYLEARLRSAILVYPATMPLTEMAFGLCVQVHDGQRAQVYEIVGEDEADARLGRIAPHAPLARALMGARPGDTVALERPSGVLNLTVQEIFRADDPRAEPGP
ncbi:MAG: GreA/GreB family elongation factor, partial [Paracoccaceae bacterium]